MGAFLRLNAVRYRCPAGNPHFLFFISTLWRLWVTTATLPRNGVDKMELKKIPLKNILPYPNNPRKNDGAVDAVAESIKQCQYITPIVVDEDMVILAGHTRYKALKKLGRTEAEIIIKEGLTEEQKRKYRLLDNKTNEFADWDLDLLAEELEGLDFEDFDFDWGIDDEEEPEVEEDDYDEEPPAEPKAKRGDIYQLGNHRLMCGDSTDPNDVEMLMDGANADMVFTDPPYGMSAVSKSGVLSERYKTDIMNDETNEVAVDSFNLAQSMFEDAKQVWWGANYYTECLPSAECWIVWDKNNGASDQTDCELAWSNFRSVVRQFTMASEKTNRVHPTQKPVKLIQQIFKKFEKDTRFESVVDLFGGSGSTLIACEQMGRNCYTMELDPKYVDVIIDRWEKLTGEKAVLL